MYVVLPLSSLSVHRPAGQRLCVWIRLDTENAEISDFPPALAIDLILVAALVLLGLRRFPPGMPLASTCSAAISAACHPRFPVP